MKRNRKNRFWPLILIVAISWLAFVSPKPASAMSEGDTLEITAIPIGSVLVVGVASYLLYKNRFNQPADAKGNLGYKGPGEFFVGGFFGGSFVPGTNWTYQIAGQDVTARNMTIDPGVTGGIKLGYFLDSCPYVGVEAEGSIGNQPQSAQTVSLHPPALGASTGRWTGQTLLVWTMALHLVGRYGFLQDQEVPFGRLQPYVGIGPGLVMLYADADSAKNFGLELEAGLRYMFTKHLGGFVEYKFSKQWAVELDSQQLANLPASIATFDFARHQVVAGLSYHF